MPPHPRPLRDARLRDLQVALGVTRIARVTGLDRTGVEVAAAIRPGGHVLQVTNGKGATFEDAARGALAEAAELWAAERASPGPLGSAAEVRAAQGPGVRVIDPEELGADAPGTARLAWTWATVIGPGRGPRGRALVPAAAVHCPPAGSGLLGAAGVCWTSNGMGAHPARGLALLHALLEAIERDQLARALPDGFTERALARRLLDPASLEAAAPRAAALARRLAARGFEVHLLDCAPDGAGTGDLGLPVAAALLVDEEGGPVPVAAGYACRPTQELALEAALLEAAQSRATEIHGAREDVLHGDRAASRVLAERCAAARPRRRASGSRDLRARGPTLLPAVVARLARAGRGPIAAVDLPAPLAVVKVLVPGLRCSELLG